MTTDLDILSLSPEEMEQQDALDNSFSRGPVCFEGDWDGEVTDELEEFHSGESYARLGFTFTNCHFIEVKAQDLGKWKEGSSFTAKVRPLEPGDKKAYQKELGMTIKESGHPLSFFAGSRVRLTEHAKKPWATANKPTVFYKWEKVGASANGAKPVVEIPAELTEAALRVIAAGTYTENNVGMALLRDRSCNQNTTLNGKFGDGSWLKEQIAAGRITADDAGTLSVVGLA